MTWNSDLVFPWGVEPQSSEPESDILSIELWELIAADRNFLVLEPLVRASQDRSHKLRFNYKGNAFSDFYCNFTKKIIKWLE